MKKEGEEGKKLSRWRVGEEEGSRIGDREKMGLSRRLHSSLHFSAASENNASPTQSGKHYSLLLRPFSTDSRSQFCNDPSRRAVLPPSPSFFPPRPPHTCTSNPTISFHRFTFSRIFRSLRILLLIRTRKLSPLFSVNRETLIEIN